MRSFRRRSRAATPVVPQRPAQPFTELCWLLGTAGRGSIRPARVTVRGSRFVIAVDAELANSTEQVIGRLALVDGQGADLELHFVTTENAIACARLRFSSTDKAEVLLRHLLEAYERTTAQQFPSAWLRRRSVSPRDPPAVLSGEQGNEGVRPRSRR